MRRRRAPAALVALVLLALPGCADEGAGSTNAVWRSDLLDRLDQVRDAYASEDPAAARRRLSILITRVRRARDRGVLDDERADAILGELARVWSASERRSGKAGRKGGG